MLSNHLFSQKRKSWVGREVQKVPHPFIFKHSQSTFFDRGYKTNKDFRGVRSIHVLGAWKVPLPDLCFHVAAGQGNAVCLWDVTQKSPFCLHREQGFRWFPHSLRQIQLTGLLKNKTKKCNVLQSGRNIWDKSHKSVSNTEEGRTNAMNNHVDDHQSWLVLRSLKHGLSRAGFSWWYMCKKALTFGPFSYWPSLAATSGYFQAHLSGLTVS